MIETWILVLIVASGGWDANKTAQQIGPFDNEAACKTAKDKFRWPTVDSARCVRIADRKAA